MSEELPPLPPECAELIQPTALPPLSAETRARLLERIERSVGLPPSGGSPGTPPGAAGLGGGAVGAIALATFVAGAATALWVERTFFPVEPRVERIVVITPAPVSQPVATREEPPPVIEPLPPPPRPRSRLEKVSAPPAEPPVVAPAVIDVPPEPVVISSRERQFIESARTALLKRDARGALAALAEHRQVFALGQLAEERDSLEIQALLQAGQREEANTAAAAFHRNFPDSVFGPSIDVLLR